MHTVYFSQTADKQFQKLDTFTQKMIAKYISTNLEGSQNPRMLGKALKGNLQGYWRYQVGKYRLIVEIQDDKLVILVLKIGHRREVYDR